MITKPRINITNEDTVRRFIDGDIKAFDDIYFSYNHKLQKFIFSLAKVKPDTEDLVQEVFIKIWANRSRIRNIASFDNYIFTIAYNTTISHLREKAKDFKYVEYVKSVQIEIGEVQPSEEINEDDLGEQLRLLIEKMPSRQREVFKMKHFQDCSYKEIAENLNISVNTVENHIVKAHKHLRVNLGKAYLPVLMFLHLFL